MRHFKGVARICSEEAIPYHVRSAWQKFSVKVENKAHFVEVCKCSFHARFAKKVVINAARLSQL